MKTKIKYTVEREDGYSVETYDSDYAQRLAIDLKYRRTGRSTRTLFNALSSADENIVIISSSPKHRDHLFQTFIDLLKKLDFEFEIKANLTVVNMGRRFMFKSDNSYNQDSLRGLNPRLVIYDHE